MILSNMFDVLYMVSQSSKLTNHDGMIPHQPTRLFSAFSSANVVLMRSLPQPAVRTMHSAMEGDMFEPSLAGFLMAEDRSNVEVVKGAWVLTCIFDTRLVSSRRGAEALKKIVARDRAAK